MKNVYDFPKTLKGSETKEHKAVLQTKVPTKILFLNFINKCSVWFGGWWQSQPQSPRALTALGGLVGAVPAVIHRVTLPPERDALVGFATELQRGRASRNKRFRVGVYSFVYLVIYKQEWRG